MLNAVYAAYGMSDNQNVQDCSLCDAVDNDVAELEHRNAFQASLSQYLADHRHNTKLFTAERYAEIIDCITMPPRQ